MDQVVPIGYATTRMGTFLAGAVAGGTGLLTWLFVRSGADIADLKYFCMGAAVLMLLCVLSDVTKNRKNRRNIAHMESMLSCPSVAGEVREIKRIPYYFGREFREDPKVYAKESNVVYRVVAAIQSPVTGKEEIVISQPYSRKIDKYIRSNTVTVHYAQDGQYWIELAELD